MRITPSKGRTQGYSDFYKGATGASAGVGNKIQSDAAKTGGSMSPGSGAFKKREDENEEDKKKLAIRRRLQSKNKLKVK